MQYEKMLELLARSDVKELALQTNRPPCALIGEAYVPIVQQNLTEDDVIAAAMEAGGQAEVLHLLSGPRKWEFIHPTVGTLRISAGYHGQLLQVRVKLLSPAPGGARVEPPVTRPSSTKEAPVGGAPPQGLQGRKNFQSPSMGDGQLRARPGPPAPPEGKPRPASVADGASLFGKAKPDLEDFGDMPMPPLHTGAARPEPGRAPTGPRKAAPEPPSPGAVARSIDDLFSEPPPPPDAEPANDNVDDALPLPESEPPPALSISEGPERMFESLLELSRKRRASDLHILADRPPMLRIAGELVPQGEPLPAAFVEQMLMPHVPERVRADLRDHGACDFALDHPRFARFRVNVTRQRTGYKLSARPIGDQVFNLAQLGLPEAIAAATEHHQGLIVVTGPTGHGKTTTLAAIVDIVNSTRAHHIITVEDPVEYVHPRKKAMMSQREVNRHTKAFAAALKGSLREDPDVIVVGELRDTETVRMALSASETGHLVISTMNTPSAAKAIERIIDLFPAGDQPQVRMTLAGGLRLVVSQRLVPTADKRNVAAAVELLPGTNALWALIRDNKTFQIPSLQQRGKALGIIRLDDSLAELVKSGRVTLEVAKEFAEAPDQLEALVQGKPARPPDQQFNANNLDPTREATQAAQKFGKDMLSKAGKLFGGEKK
jgi:twitching motility protein PilT